MSKQKPIVLSGIQPSGKLNIAHYIGAIKNWVKLQNEYQCLFALVDLHAITVRQDPKTLHENCLENVALYIACGIDPEKSSIFIQSQVAAHTQLAWVLNCYTHMGELNRMTQFKDKAKRHEANINVGLFDYPVLMAADILLYDANFVPVGEDQTQHLELTRDLAQRFNQIYGDIFVVPEMLAASIGGRIMSLQDPEKKMSKSDVNESSYITLLDSPETVRQKMKRAVTDSGKEVIYDETNKAGIANLLTLFAAITNKPIKQLEQQYQNAGYGKFKGDLAEAVIAFLTPIQKRYHEIRHDEKYLLKTLKHGANIANQRANATLQKVHKALGFVVD